jgi:tetratricopeptide (TPR) repeat protein
MAVSRFGLRERILAAFIALLVGPLAALSAVGYYSTGRIGDTLKQDAAAGLLAEETDALQKLVQSKANTSNLLLTGWERDAETLRRHAQDLWNNRSTYANSSWPPASANYQDSAQTPLVPGLPAYGFENRSAGEGNGAWADWKHHLQGTPYINRSNVARARADPAFAKWISEETNTSLLMDPALKAAYDKNAPNVVLTWMVRIGGVSNSYSKPPLDFGYLLWLATVTGGKEGLKGGFDEDNASYVKVADPQRNPKRAVVWTQPYYDSVGNGWLVSAIAPVYAKVSGTEKFIGVVGVDVQLSVLESLALGTQVLRTGHGFLVDRSGLAVAHPKLEDERERRRQAGEDLEVKLADVALESSAAGFQQQVERMKKGESGVAKVAYEDGRNYYVAFAPVARTGLSFGAVVPEEEVLEAVNAASARIAANTAALQMQLVILLLVGTVAVTAVGVVLANRIVRPLKQLTLAAKRISEGDLDVELTADAKDEVADLLRAFGNLLITLRLGNISYYQGDNEKALENYTQALELFEQTGSLKGQAMCHNNLGNIHRALGDNDRALAEYKLAAEIDAKIGDPAGIARRRANMALAYRNLGKHKEAMVEIEFALSESQDVKDETGVANVHLTKGVLLQDQGDSEGAMQEFLTAMESHKRLSNDREVAKALNNIGLLHLNRGDAAAAEEALRKAVDIFVDVEDDRSLANACTALADALLRRRMAKESEEFSAKAAELRARIGGGRKSVVFVLDISGSMAEEGRIEAAVEGAISVFDRRVSEGDEVALVTFSSSSSVAVPMAAKRDAGKRFRDILENIEVQGMTSFYDALGDAVSLLKRSAKASRKWVVALTDGEDNTSYKFGVGKGRGRKDISKYAAEQGVQVTMIIIGVGGEIDEATMKRIAGSSGYYIPVSKAGTADMGAAIKQAYAKAGDLFSVGETVEGFVPED